MANREVFVAGLGVGFAHNTLTSNAAFANGSLTWLPMFVTTQAAWSSGTSYTASTDLATGSQVSVSGSSATFVCTTAGGGTSTVNPATGTGGTTAAGALTTVLSDGYQWLCIGNSTADFTNLANTNQAVSQILLDSRPSQSEGDTMMEIGISLASGSSGAASAYITIMQQWLNQDGSTYGDGLGGGSSPSSAQNAQGNIFYSAGKSSPIVGSVFLPLRWGRMRACLINNSGNALSSSTHVVAFRTGVFGLNG